MNHDQNNSEKDKKQDINFTNDNKNINSEQPASQSGDFLPEDDPAVINPDELATYPKEQANDSPDIEDERDAHLASQKTSPVREGRNITRTDNNPDRNGFM